MHVAQGMHDKRNLLLVVLLHIITIAYGQQEHGRFELLIYKNTYYPTQNILLQFIHRQLHDEEQRPLPIFQRPVTFCMVLEDVRVKEKCRNPPRYAKDCA